MSFSVDIEAFILVNTHFLLLTNNRIQGRTNSKHVDLNTEMLPYLLLQTEKAGAFE